MLWKRPSSIRRPRRCARCRGNGMGTDAGQNLAVAERAAPQFEQVRASGVAHSSQNFAPGTILVLAPGTLHPGLPIAVRLEDSNGGGRLDRSPVRGQPAL